MSYTKTQGRTLNLNETHHSDGSELIPAEVQANIRHDVDQPINNASVPGYTIDDEGIIDNYAIEPDLSAAEYPSPRQQRRYIAWGAGAILFVVLLLLVSFAVS